MNLTRLQQTLLPAPVEYFSDLPWLQRAKRTLIQDLVPSDLRNAAVLVPLIERPDGWKLILTRRNQDLKNHAGQVSFPGGSAEIHDTNAAATAIREANEEIGLRPDQIDVLGYLPEHPVISGFSVTPVVAQVEPPVDYQIDSNEVSSVFELPWQLAVQPETRRLRKREIQGQQREFYSFEFAGETIWGATAAMVVDLTLRYLRLGDHRSEETL